MNILVTIDENYMDPLKTMLCSLFLNNPHTEFDIYLLYSDISEESIAYLKKIIEAKGYHFYPIKIDDHFFDDAKITKTYPKTMYYRLLAHLFLPQDIDKILYLDPDILIINPLKELYDIDLMDYFFAAAAHTGKTELANNVNKVRLGTEEDYYNSGVILMNLKMCRKYITAKEIFDFVELHSDELIMPDQDVLNMLYSKNIMPLSDIYWNYDARNFSTYLMATKGIADNWWVMQHTSILHFNGKRKPWKQPYQYRFGVLYQHYMQITQRYFD